MFSYFFGCLKFAQTLVEEKSFVLVRRIEGYSPLGSKGLGPWFAFILSNIL